MFTFHRLSVADADRVAQFHEALASIPESAIQVYFEKMQVEYLQSLQAADKDSLTEMHIKSKMVVEIRERLLASRQEALSLKNQ